MAINVLDEEKLNSTIRLWQKFLRLDEWKITAEIVSGGELEENESLGVCDYFMNLRTAKIRIADAETGDRIIEDSLFFDYYDMENTLIHELLHVFLAPLNADREDIFLEQRVNHLADRLQDMKLWVEAIAKTELGDSND